MKIWLMLLWASVYRSQSIFGPAVSEPEFLQAVLDSYDVNRSFTENVLSILAMICPKSFRCADPNNDEANNYSMLKSGTYGANFSTEFYLSRKPSLMSEARTILENSLKDLQGRCSTCACDDDCMGRQNCCPVMGKEFQRSDETIPQKCRHSSIDPLNKKYGGPSYFMVTDCHLENNRQDSVYKCRNPRLDVPAEATPVYSAFSKRIYKNKYCADCNADNQITPWTIMINAGLDEPKLTEDDLLPSRFDEIFEFALHNKTKYKLYFVPPINIFVKDLMCTLRDAENRSIEICDNNLALGLDKKHLSNYACKMFNYTYFSDCYAYQNVFCFLCDSSIYNQMTNPCLSSVDPISFSLMISYDETDEQPGTTSKDMPCKCT